MPATPIPLTPDGEYYYLLGSATTPSTTASEYSNELRLARYGWHCYQVINPGLETVVLEVSIDGEAWVPMATVETASAFATLIGFYPWVRARRGAGVSEVTVLYGFKNFLR